MPPSSIVGLRLKTSTFPQGHSTWCSVHWHCIMSSASTSSVGKCITAWYRGHLVLSVEHPVFTARASQDWYYGQHGERLHWPVDQYQDEGPRQARFLDHDVLKYHRTVATHLNALIDSGFTITKLSEPQPTQEMLDKHPEMRDETRRPMFLLIAAVKNEK